MLEGLGTVRVDLWFGRYDGGKPGPPAASEGLTMAPIYEKSKKVSDFNRMRGVGDSRCRRLNLLISYRE